VSLAIRDATDDAGVAGFASFGDCRAWPGHRFTVEHSVHDLVFLQPRVDAR
jgi:L-amino acid N-acyltransferase YncA